MKLLHVVHEFAPFEKKTGGTGRYVHRLVREQVRLGHSVTVLTQHHAPRDPHLSTQRYFVEDEIPVVKVNISRFDHPDQLYRRSDTNALFHTLLREGNFDGVHIHHFIGLSTSIAECAMEAGIPYGITFHDFWPFCIRYHMIDYGRNDYDCARLGYGEEDCLRCLHQCHFPQNPFNEATRQFLLEYLKTRIAHFAGIIDKAAFLTGPSHFLRKIYEEIYHLPPGRIRVEPLGIDLHNAPPDKEKIPWARFGYLGSIESRKGVNLLLDAFRDLDTPLHLWGNDPQAPAFRDFARTQPNLHYHGPYDAVNDLAKIFSRIQLCIVPSLSESFGITARESLAHGVPVIASDWGGMPEAVIHGRNGLLFEVGNAEALRKAVCYATGHPEEIRQMISHTHDHLVPMERHARNLISLYKNTSAPPL